MSTAGRYREEDDTQIGSWMSVLDRLLYKPPAADKTEARSLEPLRDTIARDLAELLSTRRRQDDLVPPEFEEASRSILNFGIPATSSTSNLASPVEQSKLCKLMEEAVRIFESRLSKITMRVVDPNVPENKGKVALRFQLDANIDALMERHTFYFDFASDTGKVSVSGSGS